MSMEFESPFFVYVGPSDTGITKAATARKYVYVLLLGNVAVSFTRLDVYYMRLKIM